MDEGISGSVGELSFAFLPNLLGWHRGVRVQDASANGSRTASEHIVCYASMVQVRLGVEKSLGGCLTLGNG